MPSFNANNVDVMNAVRNANKFDSYYANVPPATQGNIQEIANNILENRPLANEFLNRLMNRIGLQILITKSWENPLALFKLGKLTHGDTVEEIATGLVKARGYDPYAEVDPEYIFGVDKPPVTAAYHKINRADMYKISVNQTEIRKAFLADDGVSNLVNSIMAMPYESDYQDEYLIMRRILDWTIAQDWCFNVKVGDLYNAAPADKQDIGLDLTEKIREYTSLLQFRSTKYSWERVPVFTKPEELVLVTTPKVSASLDVHVLAFAFNMPEARVPSRIVIVDEFEDPTVQALLMDEGYFRCWDTEMVLLDSVNPMSLNYNYFWHHQGIYSASPYMNVVKFSTKDDTVIMNTVYKPDSIMINGSKSPKPGEDIVIDYTVTGTLNGEPDDDFPQGVTFEILSEKGGDQGGYPLATGTQIDGKGRLYVGALERNDNLTIRIASVIDPSVYKDEMIVIDHE